MKHDTMLKRAVLVLAVLICANGLYPQASDDGETPDPEVFELSPFVVNESRDIGYLASETLSGTRMSASVSDVASSITVLTKEFMDDLAATGVNDALEFVPNTSNEKGGLADDPLGNRLLFFDSYRVRGFRLDGGLTTNFLYTQIPNDIYNVQRLTFARGPNSILFGLGSPGGTTNQVTKRATFNDFAVAGLHLDSDERVRTVFEGNKELIKGKLAIKVALVRDDFKNHWNPSSNKSERFFGTVELRPTRRTTIRGSFETGSLENWRTVPWTASDYYTPWVEAGRPTVDTPASLVVQNPEPGLERLSNGNWFVVIGENGVASPVPMMNWRRMGRGQSPAIVNKQGLYSITDSDLLPLNANTLGGGLQIDIDFDDTILSVEHKLTKNWFIEATFNHQDVTRDVWNLVPANFSRVYADPNTVLPDGSMNPNFGMPYIESNQSTRFYVRWIIDTARVTSSYDLDLSNLLGTFGDQFLGLNRFAVLGEQRETEGIRPIFILHNTNPSPFGGPADIFAGANRVKHRYYLDLDKGIYGASPFAKDAPIVWGGDAMADNLPTPDERGLGLAWMPSFPSQLHTFERLTSGMFAMQNFWWQNRIITTFGLREDELRIWDGPVDKINNRFHENVFEIDPRDRYADLARDVEGRTKTKGIVFKATPWLALFYNESSSFEPVTAGFFDAYGDPLPNSEGDGTDFGIRLNLFDNKVFLSATYFETKLLNQRSGQVNGATNIIISSNANDIWRTVSEYEDNATYREAPYWVGGNGTYAGLIDSTSDGYELAVTANPTKEWRLYFSVARQENTQSNFGVKTKQYLDEYLSSVENNSEWMALDLSSENYAPGERTVADSVEDLKLARLRLASLEGAVDGRQPEWSFNMNTAYRFRPDTPLKGFTIGGNARWRDRIVVGYAENEFGAFETNRPFKSDDQWIMGAFVRYNRKLFNESVNWTIQLTVNNLLDDGLIEFEAMDDGKGNPEFVRWQLPRSRTFVLVNNFRF